MAELFKSKSNLAKLLAQENLNVEHRNASTAYFDLESRTVVLPMFKEMNGDLYDLLVGHEVGHGLFTPKEGWHDAVTNNPAFKSYLNVVEDARIERLMKDKYPGMRRSFNIAYKHLNEEDFFGLKGRDVNQMRLIDRINVFYKLGAFHNVVFTPDEMKFLDRINAAQSFDDVRDIANDVYSYAQSEKTELNEFDDLDSIKDFVDGDEFSDADFDDAMGGGSSEDETSEEDFDSDGQSYSGNGFKGSNQPKDVSSETDRAFRNNERKLIDDKTKGTTHIFTIPEYNSNVIVSYQKVHAAIEKNIKGNIQKYRVNKLFEKNRQRTVDFFNRVNPVVNYMIKEFEVRKNATQMMRAKVSKSGKIDPKKLSRYNINNDIFKRITSVPEGKNHGLVMVIDLSGSMQSCIESTFEQAIVLTQFCRKINIPFDVYGFTDATFTFRSYGPSNASPYIKVNTDLAMRNEGFRMKHYLSSNMSSSVYKKAVDNMLYVGNLISQKYTGYILDFPPEESLNGTPLTEAVAASIDIVEKFKINNKLEVVNCIFLTDGCGDNPTSSYSNHALYWKDSIYIEHKKTKIRVKYERATKNTEINDHYTATRALIQAAQQITGAKYTGYYIGKPDDITNFVVPYEYYIKSTWRGDTKSQRKDIRAKLTEDGFIASNKFGFSEFFFVLNSNLKIEESGIEIDNDATKAKIARAFSKSMNSRGLQRMFLNKFVQNLAA